MTSGFFNFFNSMIHRVKSVNARSRRDLSPLKPRRLLAESLEDRQLLAVDVLGMSAAIADNANVIAISSSELSIDAIKLAIQEAATTPGDDVIQLPSGALEFTSANDEIVIDVDSSAKGAIGIVADGLTIDAKEFSRVFAVKNGEVYLEGLALKGGVSDYGGALANGGDLTLVNVTITESSADFGGAIANKGDLKIQDSSITLNASQQDGAAIYEGDFAWTQDGGESPEWSVIPDQIGAKGTTITVDLADYINDGDWEYSFVLGETGSLILATEPTLSADGVLSFTFIGDSDYYGEADYSAIEVTVTAEKGSESDSQTFTVALEEQISMKIGAILSNMDFDAVDLEYFIQDGRGAARRSGYAYADGFPAPSTSVDVSSDDLYVQVWVQDLANSKSGDDQVWDAGDYFLSSITYKLHLENATFVSLDSADYNAPYPNVYQELENGDYWFASSFMNDTKFGFAEALLVDVIKIQAIDASQPVSVTIYQDGTDLTFPVVQRNYGVDGVSKYQTDSVAINVDPSQTLFVSTISNSSEPLSAIPGSPFTTYKYEPLNPTTSNALLGATSAAPSLTISNTVIAGNWTAGDGVIYIADGGTASVYNATIAENSGSGAAIQYDGESSAAIYVANSIIVNDAMAPIPSVATAEGNLLNANISGNVEYQNGALFADSDSGDYSLAQASEAINVGVDALALDVEGAALTTDISGAPRFVAAVDAGAFEYQGVAPTAPTNLTVSDYLESSKKPVLSWTAATSADGVDGYFVYNITSDGQTLIATLAGDATSYADLATAVSLEDNATYTFAVSAFNAFGESDAANVTLDTTVPPSATLTVTAGDYDYTAHTTTLSWNAVATATGYRVYAIGGVEIGTTADTTYELTGLEDNTTYAYRVVAYNASGEGSYGDVSFTTTTPPSAPEDVAFGVYDSSTKSATLSWTASENATGYKIQSYDGSDWIDVATQSETSYTVTGMEDFETYQYRVAAYNAVGDSDWVEATVTASAIPGVPRDVTGVFNKASKTATISWKLSAGATGGYYVYEQVGDAWNQIANVASSSTSYMAQNLDLYTSYTFGVSAFNDEGESAIVPVTVSTVVAPEAPTNLTVVDADEYDGGGSVVITWDASEGADSYTISILPADGSETPIEVGSTADTTYELTSLANFSAYAVFVVAVNSAGESEGAETSFDTYCPPTEAVVVTVGDYDYVSKQIDVSWNAVAYADWYVVELTVNNLTTLVPMEDSSATSVTLTVLEDFANYTCKVTAWNLKGEGTSGSVDFYTLAPPAAPADAAFGDFVASTGKATLSWTAVDYADYYVVEKEDAGQWVVVPRTDETETTYTASGLEQNNTYSYRVSAVNAAGASDAVVVTLDTTLAEPPAAPTDFTVGSYDADSRRLTLTWTDVASNEAGYVMEYSKDGVDWTLSATMDAGTTSRVANGLTPGQTYYFRVAAFNDYGYSDWAETSFAVPAEIPSAPTNLTFGEYDATNRELEMSWTDNSDNELGFKVQCSYDGTDWFTVETVDANVTTRTATGLVEGRTYYFRVAAYNAYGVSDWATNQITIHVAGKLPPAAPSDLTFSNPVFTTSGVNLDMSWTDNSDNEDRFIVQFSYDNSTWHGAGSTDANVTSRTATGLVEGRTYYFRVAAYNSAGYSDWTTGSFDVPYETVNAPTNIVFGEYNNGTVDMSWTDNSNGEASFVVQFSYDGENWHRGGTTDVGVTYRTATGMTPGRLYYFRVAAYQNGTYSDWVVDTFQTPSGAPKAPGEITFSNYSSTDRTVQMAWEDLSNDEIGFNIEYSLDDGNTWNKSGNTSADVASRTATGLRVGRTYEFRVRSFNAYGASGWTYGEFTVPGDSAVPSAPTNFVFGDYDADAKTLAMSWTDTANNETGYRVQYSVDNGTTWYSAGLYGANTESRTATSVIAGRTYMFRVAAYNGAGLSDWLTSDAYAVEASANIPNAPTNLTFGTYDAETRSVEMSWTDNATNEKGFKVQYSVDDGQSWNDSAYLQANVTSRTATQLVAGRVYNFRVAAYNGYGYSDWLYNSFSVPTTTAVPVPTNIAFNYLESRGVLGVSWDDVASGYNCLYTNSAASDNEWYSLASDGNTATISQVVGGLTYTVRVQSVEGGAVSEWAEATYNTGSGETNVTEAPSAPSNLSFSRNDSTNVLTVSWTDNSDDETGFVVELLYEQDSNVATSSAVPEGGQGGDPPSGDGPGGNAQGGDGPGGNAQGGGSSSTSVTYAGATEITSGATQTNQTYSSTTSDESALLISTSEAVTITNPTVTKSGDSDGGDNCNFYGQNAALLVKDGSTTTITGGTVTSNATGANGVFSYGGNGGQNGATGDGTTVIITDTTITTTGSGSGGIMTTGGGITKAYNLTVTTSGGSSAPIRTDRGGGTVYVDGGTYTSNGLGSPAIYSTADITVENATLVSNLSEGVCIEGLNSITLNNCDLTANNTRTNGNATFLDTIMIYQSMSGDADSGTSVFSMTDGSLTSKSGHVFHVTNTSAIITLSGVAITNEDSDDVLLSVCDDGWSGGSNVATLNASGQTLSGAILVGSDSELTLNLSAGSSLTGSVSGNISNASGATVSTSVGKVAVTLDESSTWTLTGDSYVTSFSGNAANVISNGYALYVNGIALDGTSETGTNTGDETEASWTTLATLGENATSYDLDLDAYGDGTFSFRVYAFNSFGNSDYATGTYVYSISASAILDETDHSETLDDYFEETFDDDALDVLANALLRK